MFKRLSEFFMIITSLCGLMTVVIATGIIAFCDKYFIIIIAPLCGIITVVFTIGIITAFDKYLLSFCYDKLATTVKAASNRKISQAVRPHPCGQDAAPITIKNPSVKSWVSATEAT
jgi:c-di-AMP phosphodiesterase-like protein